MNFANNIASLIGNTPIVRLKQTEKDSANIFVKLEYFNPGGSIKDRVALQIIEDAENDGLIKPGDTLIEATSGNTGIGAALVGADKGYKVVIVMPEDMSTERRNLMQAYGAELVLTDMEKGMVGAIEKANKLVDECGYYPLNQFSNPSTVKAHRQTTGKEIIKQMGDKTDVFIAGIGTGGTITGVGEVLKEYNSKIQIIGVEPAESPVLSKGVAGAHGIQGIGAGFIPDILNTEIYDEIMLVTTEQAYDTARDIAKTEGVLGGYTTGATIFAAKKIAKRIGKNKNIVVISASNGERYLSTPLYNFEER